MYTTLNHSQERGLQKLKDYYLKPVDFERVEVGNFRGLLDGHAWTKKMWDIPQTQMKIRSHPLENMHYINGWLETSIYTVNVCFRVLIYIYIHTYMLFIYIYIFIYHIIHIHWYVVSRYSNWLENQWLEDEHFLLAPIAYFQALGC